MGITATAIYAPGDTITSAWANILRTNTGVLDSRTGGDPGSANLMLVSDGATSAAWVARLTAVTAALGYTPLKNTTDTLTGTLTLTGAVSPNSYTGGTQAAGVPSVLGLNVGTSGIAVNGAINPTSYTGGSTSTGSPSVLGLNVGNNGVAATGPANFASYTGGSAAAGSPSVLGLNVGTNGVATSGQIASSVSTGTAPFSVASTTKVTNLNADLLNGLSSSAFTVVASGSYAGDNSTAGRGITTGFLTKAVFVFGSDGGGNEVFFLSLTTSRSMWLDTTPNINGDNAVHLHASNGFVVGDGNVNGNASGWTYTWLALG